MFSKSTCLQLCLFTQVDCEQPIGDGYLRFARERHPRTGIQTHAHVAGRRERLGTMP